jgi:hypothetical protein
MHTSDIAVSSPSFTPPTKPLPGGENTRKVSQPLPEETRRQIPQLSLEEPTLPHASPTAAVHLVQLPLPGQGSPSQAALPQPEVETPRVKRPMLKQIWDNIRRLVRDAQCW